MVTPRETHHAMNGLVHEPASLPWLRAELQKKKVALDIRMPFFKNMNVKKPFPLLAFYKKPSPGHPIFTLRFIAEPHN